MMRFLSESRKEKTYGKNKAGSYTFEEVCRECPDLRLDDGAARVFINTKGTNRRDFSREFLDIMEYIGKTTDETAENSDSGRIRRIHRRVCQIRKSEKAGIKYMQRWEELAYAREDGKTEGKREAVLQLLGMTGPVTEELQKGIMAETDAGVLEKWLEIAAGVKNIDEFVNRIKQ